MTLYELLINEKSEWATARAAAVLIETSFVEVKFGDKILDKGVERDFTIDDRNEIFELCSDL